MEIRDYLKVIGRRLWLVIALPALAAVLTALVVLNQPQEYRAEANVVVPVLAEAGPSTNQVLQVISNFRSAIDSLAVTELVSRDTGVPIAELQAGLTTRQLGTSNIIEVVYRGTSKESIAKVLDQASRVTLDLLTQAEVSAATANRDAARQQYDAVVADRAAFTSETNLVLPADEYRVRANELSQLRVMLEGARLSNSPTVGQLEVIVRDRQEELEALGAQVVRFQELEERLDQANRDLESAEGQLRRRSVLLEVNREPSAVSLSATQAVPRLAVALRQITLAAVICFLLTVGVVVLLEVLGTTKYRARRAEDPSDSESDVPPEASSPVVIPPVEEPTLQPVSPQPSRGTDPNRKQPSDQAGDEPTAGTGDMGDMGDMGDEAVPSPPSGSHPAEAKTPS
jgi:capsular polysaccharide biosynthesis protein